MFTEHDTCLHPSKFETQQTAPEKNVEKKEEKKKNVVCSPSFNLEVCSNSFQFHGNYREKTKGRDIRIPELKTLVYDSRVSA